MSDFLNNKLFLKFLDAYTSRQLVYQWQNDASVSFIPGMALSQFDLMSYPYRNFTFKRREGYYKYKLIETLNDFHINNKKF